MINCLKQVVQFGLDKQIHVAGTQQELESLAGAAAGSAHRRLDVRMVLEAAGRAATSTEFVAEIRKATTARCRPRGTGSATRRRMTFALVANQQKTLDAVKLAAGAGEFRAAARCQAAAEQGLLPQGRPSIDDVGLRRRGAVQGQGRSRRSVPRRRSRARRQDARPPSAKPAARMQWPA